MKQLMKELIWSGTMTEVYDLANFMHERYKLYSKQYDWEPQEKTRVKFDDLPTVNKEVMLKLAEDIIIKHAYSPQEKKASLVAGINFVNVISFKRKEIKNENY